MNIPPVAVKTAMWVAYLLWVPYAYSRDAVKATREFLLGRSDCSRQSEERWREQMNDMRKHASTDSVDD